MDKKKRSMPWRCLLRNWMLISMLFLWGTLIGGAQTGTLVTSVEAESGSLLGGATVGKSISGFSGAGYVTNLRNSSDGVMVSVSVPTTAFYSIFVRYSSSAKKYQDINVNNTGASSVEFPASGSWELTDAGKYFLNAGENVITLKSNWGWTEIDQFQVYTTALNSYDKITQQLVDVKASTATHGLYFFLLSQYGQRIISGQTDSYFTDIKAKTGITPLYRVWDFQHYTEGYSYLWNNGGFAFGIDTGAKETENAIDWYKTTGQKGIVGFQWHWHSPIGGQAGTNTFYTESTTFDIRKAVQPGTAEYNLIIRDIDAIAVQLKKLEAANVPVLWRPLHEAGGGWFWWGAKGSESCKKLYNIIFERLNNYHQIHNLIWVWSTPEIDWYPGNNRVDIVGHDSYPGVYNYGTQKNLFDRFFNLVNGEKLVTMSENGPIPNVDDCLNYDAPWSYFMSWSDLVLKQNSIDHLKEIYTHPKVITVENDTFPRIISSVNASVCDSGSVTLEAHSNFGTVYWYATPIGGDTLQSGTEFTTPKITKTITYYIEPRYNGHECNMNRIAVTAKVSNPIQTSMVSGSSTVCQGKSGVVYSLPVDSIIDSYVWTLPTGVSAANSSASNAICVNFSTTAISGNLVVQGSNACGAGPENQFAVTVNALPSAAGTISGQTSVCKGSTQVEYAVSEIDGATSYRWTLPAGITGTSSTNHILVSIGTTAVSGSIKVKGVNDCGEGAEKSLAINVNAIPVTPVISFIDGLLNSTSTSGNQWYFSSSLVDAATQSSYQPGKSGEYYTVVTLNGCASKPSNFLWVNGTGVNDRFSNHTLNVYPNPLGRNQTQLTLSGIDDGGMESILIYGMNGRQVFSGYTSGSAIELNQSLSPGVYIVQIIGTKVNYLGKLIVR